VTRPTRSATQDVPPESVGLLQIFALFAQIGLTSFGGGLSAWIYQEVVVRRGWLREGEFIAGLTLAQVLPGPNVINIAIYVGQRLRGAVGGVTAAAAMLLPPMVVAVAVLLLLGTLTDIAWLHELLEGIAAGAVGLTVSMGIRTTRHSARDNRSALLFVAAVFVTVGLLRLPMIWVVLCAAPLSILAAYRKRR
jgi:chromate transporter